MKRILFLLCACSLFALIFQATSCKHDPITPLEQAPKISFKKDIQPVLVANCTQSGCHGSNNPVKTSLVSFADVSGQTVPGDAHKSSLYKAITATSGAVMQAHKDNRLNDLKIKQIYLWILQGVNNN